MDLQNEKTAAATLTEPETNWDQVDKFMRQRARGDAAPPPPAFVAKHDTLAEKIPWPQWLQKPNTLQTSLFGKLLDQQRRIIVCLYNSPYKSEHRHAVKMSQCCSSARVYIDPDSGQVRPWMNLCRSRMCPYCGKGRSAKIQQSLYELIVKMKQPKHLTLTYRSNDRPLSEQLRKLKYAFKRLRNAADWKKKVVGGVFTVEVTRNAETGKWHPHLHIVVDSDYLPQKRLVYLWSKYMPGGKNVWIRPVDNAHGMGWEMAKYIGKAPNTRDWTLAAVKEYFHASSGARFVQCFGQYSKHRLNVKRDKPEKPADAYYVSIRRIVRLARHGVPIATDLAVLIRRRWPLFGSYITHELPKLPPKTNAERKLIIFNLARDGPDPPPSTGPPDREALKKIDFHLFACFTRFKLLDEQAAFHQAELNEVA